MVRARFKLAAALFGFLVAVAEFSLALYNEVSLRGFQAQQSGFPAYLSFPGRTVRHLPAILLVLAGILGAVVLYPAIRGHTRPSWFAAVLAPVAALLVIYRPSIIHALRPVHLAGAVLSWAAPFWWAHPRVRAGLVVGNLRGIDLLLGITHAMRLPSRCLSLGWPVDEREGLPGMTCSSVTSSSRFPTPLPISP